MAAGGLRIDHIVVSAATLEEGARHVEEALGVRPRPGGRHEHMGTHNLLLGLGTRLYLEVIAIDPDAPRPAWPRWFRLDEFSGPPRLTNWVARTGDLDAALAAAPPGTGDPVDLARGDFRWRMAVPADGRLPFDDCFPAMISWQGDLHPSDRLPDSGCRLQRLTVSHPEAPALSAALDLADPRLAFAEGPPGLSAEIATPAGLRVLA